MPQIGGVYVPDDLSAPLPEQERPSLLSILGASAEGVFRQVTSALPYQAEVLTRRQVDPGVEQQYQRGLAEANTAFRRAAPASVSDLTSGRVGLARFGLENLVGSLPQMGVALAGAAAGGIAGGPGGALAGATLASTPVFSASNVGRAVEENGSLDVGAAERSIALAPLQGAADAAVLRFLPGAGRVLGGAAATQSGGFLTRTAKSIAKAGGTEAITEAAQQVGERAAAGIPLGNADAAAEYVNAAVTAFVVGGMLGSGGGFRRTAADAKTPDAVSDEDMIEKIEGSLDGSLRLGTPSVPRVAPVARDAEGNQLALPAPGPETIAVQDAAGRTSIVENDQFRIQNEIAPVLANLPRRGTVPSLPGLGGDLNPDIPSALAQILQQQPAAAAPAPLAASTSLSRGLDPQGALASAVPEVSLPEGSFRPFREDSVDDIDSALRSKRTSASVKAAAEAEIARRAAEARGEAELSTEDFQTRVDELKKGLRGGFVQQVTATDPNDLAEKVYDQIFTEQDTRANTRKFAQRLGILDENMEPGPLAQEVEARRAAAAAAPTAADPAAPTAPAAPVTERIAPRAPAAPEQIAEVQEAIKAAGIKRMSPATSGRQIETPADVVAALAEEGATDDTRGTRARVTQVEQVARKLGLITDDDAMDFTPKGRRVYLESPAGLEAAVSAAADRGYVGAAASQFDRGVRAELNGQPQASFSDFGEMAAYEAGKVWARDFVANGEVASAARTQRILDRNDAARVQRGSPAPGSAAAPTEGSGTRRTLTPEQERVQALNRLIDNAELSSVRDTDIAQLRRMAREGVDPAELGRAIQNVQAGRSLFEEGPRQPYQAREPRPLVRGQPRFVEMNTRTEAGKAQLRAETEVPVRIFELRNLVQFALAEKAITKARADRLNAMLDKGDVRAVERSMKNFLAEANSQGRTLGMMDPQFEQFIGDKDFMGVLDHMVSQAPSEYHAAIMKGVRGLAKRMQAIGVELNFKVVRPGDEVPAGLLPQNNRAITLVTRVPARATVYVKSIELGDGSGMNYQIVAHEMVHAVTMGIMMRGEQRGVFGKTALGKAVQDLSELQDAIYEHFNRRVEEGNLNEFEERFSRSMNNSLSNADEILAWGLTNPGMQKYLATIQYRPKQSLFARFRELLGNLLGVPVRYHTALTELLRVSEQLMETSNAELAATFPRNNYQLAETGVLMAAANEADAANRTAGATNETTQRLASMADTVVGAITPRDLKGRSRRTMLGWLSHNQIDRMFGEIMPGLIRHSDAHRERVAVRSRYEQMFDKVYQTFEKLERDAPNAAKWVGELMALTTEFSIDPDKSFEQHSHLGWIDGPDGTRIAAPGKEAEIARLAPLYERAVKMKNDLRRGNGAGWKAFTDFRALNEAQNYSRMAAELHGIVALDPELSLGVEDADVNPVDRFMREEGLSEPAAIRDWWRQALDDQLKKSNAFLAAKRGDLERTGNPRDLQAMGEYMAPIEMQIQAVYEALKSMQKAPYFHLGRFGNYFGSAVVAKQADGTADPAALRKLAAALEKAGFDDVQISTDNTRPRFMLRFETEQQMRVFGDLMLKLQQEGVVSKDDEIKRGPRNSDQNFGVADGLPEFVSRYIQSIEASPMFSPPVDATPEERAALEQRKQDYVRLALDTWLEQQPDSAISKVLVKRYEVPGYNKDMIRNYAHRWRVGAISLSNVASSPKFNKAFVEMRSQVNQAQVVEEGVEQTDPVMLNDIVREMQKRDASTPINDTADTYDKLRAFSHAYFLGFSPAYGMINMTQLGVVALPELAKKHGYTKSFGAMRRAGTSAIKILKAVAGEAYQLGPKRWADVAITEDVLRKAGLNSAEINFALQMLATGTIDIGSAARALGQIAEDREGSKTDIALKYASAIGMYTETFSRLTTALAARELHGGTAESAARYATDVVSNSMFDYQSWNTARQLGKKGFLGPVTPIVTQFMSYSAQLTEKLYSEVVAAAGRKKAGESDADAAVRRKEAWRFLGGHLAAVTALAGTMGLPFATAFAAAFERLVDAFDDDDEPYDATAAYRNFVSSVFGNEIGEVVARGLPRALGFDISARAGEQNLLPFSEFLADRRPWKESVETYAGRSLGAVPSMFSNIITGGGKLADGDLLGGMKDVLPIAFKGPIETYRMTSEGYVDTKGNKIPISPGASSYLWQLLGFAPAERAEYSEARADQASRRGEVGRRAQLLRNQIVKAILSGDSERATELVRDAQAFDQDNPAFAVVPSLASAIQRQMAARSRAASLQTPLGVPMDDIAGQQLTNYANVRVTQ